MVESTYPMPAPPAPPQASKGEKNEPAPAGPHPSELDALRRLRVLEERFLNLRKKAQLADEKLLAEEQKVQNSIRAISSELTDVHRTLLDLREGLDLVRSEMAHAATQHDVRALEKYVAYWEPLQFVTKEDLLRKENLLKDTSGKQHK